jgi:hypothetical protein
MRQRVSSVEWDRSLRRRDRMSSCTGEKRRDRLPHAVPRRNIAFITSISKQVPMFDAHNDSPLPAAYAGGTVARAGGSLLGMGAPDMAHRTAPFTIHRGIER